VGCLDGARGRLWRLRIYTSRDEAFEAAGLSERAMSGENVEIALIVQERAGEQFRLP
jgi:hypothetical protein